MVRFSLAGDATATVPSEAYRQGIPPSETAAPDAASRQQHAETAAIHSAVMGDDLEIARAVSNVGDRPIGQASATAVWERDQMIQYVTYTGVRDRLPKRLTFTYPLHCVPDGTRSATRRIDTALPARSSQRSNAMTLRATLRSGLSAHVTSLRMGSA
ncbi:hypothetical protein [Salinibacterium sp.]|uniref:hypothetical protein n=1 Tax=Salinibacterium sp. TaxID=1915057 RepID=UPI0037C724D6